MVVYLVIVCLCSFPVNARRASHFLSLSHFRFEPCQREPDSALNSFNFLGQVSSTKSHLMCHVEETRGN
jgi:hypothetical protein